MILAEALSIASREPPGPVHLDLPEDIALATAGEGTLDESHSTTLTDRSAQLARELAQALRSARRPLLVTGLSFTRCREGKRLLAFIERQRIPFVTTMHGKGFLPESHAHWAGVIGRGRRAAMKAFTDKADLIIALGYDPVEINYEEWVNNAPIMHISTEAAELGRALTFTWNEPCDLKLAVDAMSGVDNVPNEWSMKEWQDHRSSWERSLRPEGLGFAAHEVIDVLRDWLAVDGILAYDVGAHTHQIAAQWRTDVPYTTLATNGWSSMGYAMPAGYAAKLVYPEKSVVIIVGDGGFQMTAGELAMARRLNLAVPVIVLNDGWLGLMKVKQERKDYPLSGVHIGVPPKSPPHYFGVPCRPAKDAETLRAALGWAFQLGGPSVIETFIDVSSYSATVFD